MEDVTVTVGWSGNGVLKFFGVESELQIELSGAAVQAGNVVNERKTVTGAQIVKVDESGKVLDGAEFTLNGEKLTGSDGVFNLPELVYGETYNVVETEAPTGYTAATAFTLSVNANGELVANGTGVNVTLEGSVYKVKVTNVKDDGDTKTLRYTVEYYKDNVKVDDDSYTKTEDVWVNDPAMIAIQEEITASDDRYTGYQLSEVKIDGETADVADIPGEGESVKDGTLIQIYYTARSYTLTVKHQYEDGTEVTADTSTDKKYLEEYSVSALTGSPLNAGYTYKSSTIEALGSTTQGSSTVSGTMPAGNVTITFIYAPRTDISYTVEHYYEGADSPFDVDEFNNQTFGSEISAVADSDQLENGYERSRTENLPLTIGAVSENNVIKVYYKASPYDLTVNHVFDGGPKDNEDVYGTPVSTAYKSEVNVAAKSGAEIAGYEITGVTVTEDSGLAVAGDKSTVTGTMPAMDVEITFTYTPITVVGDESAKIVKVDQDGAALTGASFTFAGVQVAAEGNTFSLEGKTFVYGAEYEIVETAPEGYNGVGSFKVTLKADGSGLELVGSNANVTIDDFTITVKNEPKSYTLTVKHQYEDGTEVTADTSTDKKYLEEYSVSALTGSPLNAGYTYKSSTIEALGSTTQGSSTVSGTMPAGNVTITFIYAPRTDISYTVEHYYEGADSPFDVDEFNNQTFGSEISAVADSDQLENGYERSRTENLPLTIGAVSENNVIKVYYKASSYNLTVNHIFNGGPYDSYDDMGRPGSRVYGSDITVAAKSGSQSKGYEISSVEVTTGSGLTIADDMSEVTGTMPAMDVVITFTYTPITVVGDESAKIVKVDQDGAALTGASFTFADEPVTAEGNTFSLEGKTFVYGTEYEIVETAPEGYNGADSFKVTLKADGSGLELVGSNANVTIDGFTVTVTNTIGKYTLIINHVYEGGPLNGQLVVPEYKDENVTYGKTISVTAYASDPLDSGYTFERYVTLDWNSTEYSMNFDGTTNTVSGTMPGNHLMIEIYYAPRTDLSYTVEHYYTGTDTPFDTVTVTGQTYGSVIDSVADSTKVKAGYARWNTENLPLTISADEASNVIKVWYGPSDQTTEIGYTVEFYVNGELTERGEHMVEIWAGQTTANVAREDVTIFIERDGNVEEIGIDAYLEKLGAGYYISSQPTEPILIADGDVIKVFYRSMALDGSLNINHNYTYNTYLDDQLTGSTTAANKESQNPTADSNMNVKDLYETTNSGKNYAVTGYKVYRAALEIAADVLANYKSDTAAQLEAALAVLDKAKADAGVTENVETGEVTIQAQLDLDKALEDIAAIEEEIAALGERPEDSEALTALKATLAEAEKTLEDLKAQQADYDEKLNAMDAKATEAANKSTELEEAKTELETRKGNVEALANDEAAKSTALSEAQEALKVAQANVDGMSPEDPLYSEAVADLETAKQTAANALTEYDAAAAAKAENDQRIAELDGTEGLVAQLQAAYDALKAEVDQLTEEFLTLYPNGSKPDTAAAEQAVADAKAAVEADETYKAQLAYDEALAEIEAKLADPQSRKTVAEGYLTALNNAQEAYDKAKAADDLAQKAIDGDAAAKTEIAVLLGIPTGAETAVAVDANGNFLFEDGYVYRVEINYYAETRATTPPVTPPSPPVTPPVTPVTPVTPPVVIEDPDTPLGALPGKSNKRRGLYTILDGDTPLGALPTTSGSRGKLAGGLGAFLLATGAALGLFKKRKKDEEI